MNRRSLLASAALALAARRLPLPAWTTSAEAETAGPVWRHGASPFGDLKYPAGFKQFDYVNASAPKGGVARQIAVGLAMSLDERRERWQSMVTKLRRASVQNWFTDFLHTLSEVRRAPAIPANLPLVLDLAHRRAAQQR